MSGVTLSVCIVAAALPGSTTGPGRAATPGMAGAVTGFASASAAVGASSADAATAAPTAIFIKREAERVVVLMVVVPSRLSRLGDDRDRVLVRPGLAGVGGEADLHDRVTERVVGRDVPEVRPEPDPVGGCAVGAPSQVHVRLAGDRVVRVVDVLRRERLAVGHVHAPRAEHELLAAP